MPTPPPDLSALRLGDLFQQLMWALHRHSAGETLRIMNEASLTLPQMVALHTLHYAGPCTVTRLTDALRLSPSATSHLVDRLVERGLVDRAEDPEDRRQKRVAITPTGQALLERLAAERLEEFRDAVLALPPDLVAQLLSVFERVIVELDAPKEKP